MATASESPRLDATRDNQTRHVLVMPTSDFAAYTRFKDSFFSACQPRGRVEVPFMAGAAWKINRSTACQNQILSLRTYKRMDTYSPENNPPANAAFAIASAVANMSKDLANVSIYEQEEIEKQEAQPPSAPAHIPAPYHRTKDGFVFSIAETKEDSRFRERVQQAPALPGTEQAAA